VIAGLGIAFIFRAHRRNRTSMNDGRHALTSMVSPIVRQWFVLSRKDKVLLPPAQAMRDSQRRGKAVSPALHGFRLRLTWPTVRGKRG
jgi:LysR family transcriptional regulator for metE and metH